MIRVVMFILALVGLSWGQAKHLSPIRTKKEWVLFTALMIVIALVGASLELDKELPSPMSVLRGAVEPIGRQILH